MRELVKKYFEDKLKSPSTLTKAIKTASVEIINYLNKLLEKSPEWEKLSYLIIGLVTRERVKKMFILWKNVNI
jgi:hypothetical protein